MKRQRGAITKGKAKSVLVWFPERVLPAINEAITSLDTDRSKFIRSAVREKLERHGIKVESAG